MKKLYFLFLIALLVIGCSGEKAAVSDGSVSAPSGSLSEKDKYIQFNVESTCHMMETGNLGDPAYITQLMKEYEYTKDDFDRLGAKYARASLKQEVSAGMAKKCPDAASKMGQGMTQVAAEEREQWEQFGESIEAKVAERGTTSTGSVDWGNYDFSGAFEAGNVVWCKCFINDKLVLDPRKKVDCESRGGWCIEEWNGAE